MDDMINKLMAILLMIKDELKFAEAKNAILLGFSGAGITATITYFSAVSNISKSVRVGVLLTMLLLCICSFICSLSFLPRTNLELIVWKRSKPGRNSKGKPSDDDNLYFFGHLYKYHPSELVDAFNRLYFEDVNQWYEPTGQAPAVISPQGAGNLPKAIKNSDCSIKP